MVEGWHGDDYLILFDEQESKLAQSRYDFARLLPEFCILGLKGWDDFLVKDSAGRIFSIPAVPVDRQYLQPYTLPTRAELEGDARFAGKIKWYVTPIAFGGDPNQGPNLTWVTHDQHGQLVRFWNERYRSNRA